jgi:hypothetical protein
MAPARQSDPEKNGAGTKASRITQLTVFSSIGLVVVVLTAWAFSAYLHPDRVVDFSSFLQLCASVVFPK